MQWNVEWPAGRRGGGTPAASTMPIMSSVTDATLYERVGGMPFFERLVDAFYRGVQTDPDLLALYPKPEDLAAARRHLTLFLAQYWGGPTTYLQLRGHPRLRARHLPFPIGDTARDRWLTHMRAAVVDSGAPPEEQERLLAYVTVAADAMRNIEEPPTS